ncbi:MAG: hypothetical protein KDC87_14095 [Planctomycetes bacterium]|nr:hypothetical protein [Planctomycetota bacterium]
MTRRALAFPVLLAAILPAQEFTETFPTNGKGAPTGWTAHSGKFEVLGGKLITDGAPVWSYLTKDGYKPTNCVIDVEAGYYGIPNASVQFVGAVARFAQDKDTLMGKIQENNTATADFDRGFLLERTPSGTTTLWRELNTKVPNSAILRFMVVGNRMWMQVDEDKNGRFEQTLTTTIQSTLTAGLIGVCIWGLSELDNFEYHDSVLRGADNAVPRIGTTYPMELTTTARRATPWRIVLSASNQGFAFGSRRIPVARDAFFELSLAHGSVLGLQGDTDASGKAKPGLVIPNVESLIGFTVFATAVTLDATRPEGVDNITNEIEITFSR